MNVFSKIYFFNSVLMQFKQICMKINIITTSTTTIITI